MSPPTWSSHTGSGRRGFRLRRYPEAIATASHSGRRRLRRAAARSSRAASPRGSSSRRDEGTWRRPPAGRSSRARRLRRAESRPHRPCRRPSPARSSGRARRRRARGRARRRRRRAHGSCRRGSGRSPRRCSGRSSPSITSSASPASTRKSSWSFSRWYIAIGSPGPSTVRLIPSCVKSNASSMPKPSNSHRKPRPPRSCHGASRALSTNHPSPLGTSPCSVATSSASRTIDLSCLVARLLKTLPGCCALTGRLGRNGERPIHMEGVDVAVEVVPARRQQGLSTSLTLRAGSRPP